MNCDWEKVGTWPENLLDTPLLFYAQIGSNPENMILIAGKVSKKKFRLTSYTTIGEDDYEYNYDTQPKVPNNVGIISVVPHLWMKLPDIDL